VSDPAGGGDGLDVVGILEAFRAVPDADPAAEHDRYLDKMHVVDQPGGEEVAYDGGAAADPDVLTTSCFAGCLERLSRRRVEEVERGATLQLDRRPRAVSEDEGRGVERGGSGPTSLASPGRPASRAGRTCLRP
jgi:hypothetical protein